MVIRKRYCSKKNTRKFLTFFNNSFSIEKTRLTNLFCEKRRASCYGCFVVCSIRNGLSYLSKVPCRQQVRGRHPVRSREACLAIKSVLEKWVGLSSLPDRKRPLNENYEFSCVQNSTSLPFIRILLQIGKGIDTYKMAVDDIATDDRK